MTRDQRLGGASNFDHDHQLLGKIAQWTSGRRKRIVLRSQMRRQALRWQLMERLNSLPFPAYLECIRTLLQAMGYEYVIRSGRNFWRGRSSTGGYDLKAHAQTGVTRTTILVQVKRYRRPVSRRFVNELRGAMETVGARHGLIFTTSVFAPAANRAVTADPKRSIRLVDGNELLDWLISYQVGVRQTSSQHPTEAVLDVDFFRCLARDFPEPQTDLARPNAEKAAQIGHDVPNGDGNEPMMWRTHVLAGINSLWALPLLDSAPKAEQLPLLMLGAAFGALLPDLDGAHSKLKYLRIAGIEPFLVPADFLHRTLGHRGFLHSALGCILLAVLLIWPTSWWGWQFSVAIWLGYASHLIMDAGTKSGIPLRWPDAKSYYVLPSGLRFTTGSRWEELLLPILGYGAIALAATIAYSSLL